MEGQTGWRQQQQLGLGRCPEEQAAEAQQAMSFSLSFFRGFWRLFRN